MPKVNFINQDGSEQTLEIRVGYSIMTGAVAEGLRGITADCGGACACGTCHVYVDENWVAATGPASSMENDMLEFAEHVRPNSRLSCQITMRDELDGITVTIPQPE